MFLPGTPSLLLFANIDLLGCLNLLLPKILKLLYHLRQVHSLMFRPGDHLSKPTPELPYSLLMVHRAITLIEQHVQLFLSVDVLSGWTLGAHYLDIIGDIQYEVLGLLGSPFFHVFYNSIII